MARKCPSRSETSTRCAIWRRWGGAAAKSAGCCSGAHYRKKLNFTLEALGQARETLGRFDEFFARLRGVSAPGDGAEAEAPVAAAREAFASAMADDLNVSEAFAAMFELLRAGNKLADCGTLSAVGAGKILGAFREFDRIIGCLEPDRVHEDGDSC